MKKLKLAILVIVIAFISSINFNSSEFSFNEAAADVSRSQALAQGFTLDVWGTTDVAYKEAGQGWTSSGHSFYTEWIWQDTDGDGDYDYESKFEMQFYDGEVIVNEATYSSI